MWFFEVFFKKVFTNHKKPYIMQMKTKRNNINQENKQHKTTTQQHNKTAHLWTKSEEFYYEDLRVKICTGFYQNGE